MTLWQSFVLTTSISYLQPASTDVSIMQILITIIQELINIMQELITNIQVLKTII